MNENLRNKIISHYLTIGSGRFYKWLISFALEQIEAGNSPHFDLLNRSNQFLYHYRKDKIELYRDLSFVFKRAAHSVYRIMLRKNLINRNKKFLNLVNI